MFKKFIVAASLLLTIPAFAQSVQQSGTVTAKHVAAWVTSGVIGDGGSSASSPISSIGVTNNGGAGICVNSALPTAAGYNALCFGASTSSTAVISLQNYGTAPAENITFNINGSVQGFPTVTPLPVTVGNVVCFSTTGGGLTDCGLAPSTIPLVVGTTPVTGGASNCLLYDLSNILTCSTALPNGTTATTQSPGDNTTKVATDTFVQAATTLGPCTTFGAFLLGTGSASQCSTVNGSQAVLNPLFNSAVSGVTSGLFINAQSGGSGLTGAGPITGGYSLITEGTAGSTAEIDKIGWISGCIIAVNDTGGGGCYIGNGAATVNGSGAAINRLVGYEPDMIIKIGSGTVNYRYGFSAVNGTNGVATASTLDTALFIGNIGGSGGSFFNAMANSNSLGQPGLATTANWFSCDFSCTFNDFAHFPGRTVSGDILNFTNAVLTGGGSLTITQGLQVSGGPATLSSGQGALAASAAGGAIVQGFGASFDLSFNNNTGTNVCAVATGTRTLNCNTITITNPLGVASGGTGIASGTSGGILGYTASGTLASSGALTANAIVLGGGAGATPTVLGSLGTTTTVLHGNVAGAPSFAAVVSADMNITPTTCTNQFVTAVSSGGVGTCTTDTLASAQHANQGTTTTVLHGNAAGNPSFGAIALTTDVTGTLPIANGGTNDTGTAWTSFTPTFTCGSATFTNNSSSSKTLGKTTWAQIDVTISAIGSCTTPITFTAPNTAQTGGAIVGEENVNGSASVNCVLTASSATVTCRKTSNVAFQVNDRIIASGVYQNQ